MIRAQPRTSPPIAASSWASPPSCSLGFASQARSADVIAFTGNVAKDFPTSPGTSVIAGRPQ